MVTLEATDAPVATGELIQRALAGDEAAFATIVRVHRVELTRICFAVCGDAVIAEEAVAAAWPIAWQRLHTLREPDRLRPWLIAIAVNEARQIVRRRTRRRVVELDLSAGDAVTIDDPATRVRDLDLIAAFQKLHPDDRALLAMRYVAGLDSTELSRSLGLTPSGVRARLGRLLNRLRQELGDD